MFMTESKQMLNSQIVESRNNSKVTTNIQRNKCRTDGMTADISHLFMPASTAEYWNLLSAMTCLAWPMRLGFWKSSMVMGIYRSMTVCPTPIFHTSHGPAPLVLVLTVKVRNFLCYGERQTRTFVKSILYYSSSTA